MTTTTTGPGTDLLADLLGTTVSDVTGVLALIEDAEDEIQAAMRRHPKAADRIWHSFLLLQPTLDLTSRNPVLYRAHCRELLERVAAGADTRLGTAVECIAALSETSTLAPLTTTGTGLYMRLWAAAGLPDVMDGADGLEHYEAIRGSQMDQDEAMVRAKLAQADRRLPDPIEHVTMCPQTTKGR